MIKLQALGLQVYQKETPRQVYSCELYETFKNTTFQRTTWWLLLLDLTIKLNNESLSNINTESQEIYGGILM